MFFLKGFEIWKNNVVARDSGERVEGGRVIYLDAARCVAGGIVSCI